MLKQNIGPLQLVVFSFEQPRFEGKIADQIKKLNDKKMLRLVDGLAIHKTVDGNIETLEASHLSLDEATEYGAYIGALLGIGSGDERIAESSARAIASNFHERYEYGLDAEDVRDIAENIPEGSAALVLLVEHLWAIPLRDAVREAGGMLVAQDFLAPELLIAAGKEIYASAT